MSAMRQAASFPGNISASGTIVCDAGVLVHKGSKPFNVARSPVWDRTACINQSAGVPCGESPGSRWASEAEARDIVAYLIETYPAGTRDHAGLSSPSVHFINGEKHDHHIYPSARFRTD